MNKAFAVESVKTLGEAGSGQFEALVSVFNNIDAVNDRVLDGAFQKAIKEQSAPPPVVWSHFWSVPPIGETIDWFESPGKGLQIKGELFVGADDNHMYADMAYAGMKSRGGRAPALREFSFSYDIPDGGAETVVEQKDGSQMRVQNLKELFPVSEVGPCLRGCNPATEVLTPAKSYGIKLDVLRELSPEAYEKARAELQRLTGKSHDDIESYPVALVLEMIGSAASKGLLLTDEVPDDAVLSKKYPAEVTELLLVTPGH